MRILSFDIGGTFTKWAIIDINDKQYQIIYKNKYLTCEYSKDGVYILNTIGKTAQKLIQHYQFKAVSLSITGIVDSQKKMVITPSYIFKNFHRKPIDKIINKYIKLPVYCANDARCALLGEQMFGALKNYHQDSVMLVIGTGIGTALFIDNKIYDGMSHSAGEGGLLFSNETNYKLQSNTFNLINNAKKIKNTIFKGEQVLKLAKTNPLLKNIVNQWYRGIAKGLNDYCYILNPCNIIIGGAIAESKCFSLKVLKSWMLKLCVEPKLPIKNVKLLKAKLHSDATLIGAACLSIKNCNQVFFG